MLFCAPGRRVTARKYFWKTGMNPKLERIFSWALSFQNGVPPVGKCLTVTGGRGRGLCLEPRWEVVRDQPGDSCRGLPGADRRLRELYPQLPRPETDRGAGAEAGPDAYPGPCTLRQGSYPERGEEASLTPEKSETAWRESHQAGRVRIIACVMAWLVRVVWNDTESSKAEL